MAERPSITCPRCGMTSRHPQDVADRYCGHCHQRHPAWPSLRAVPHEFIGRLGGACPLCDQPKEHGLHAGMASCDFCNSPRIAWRYPTRRATAAPARPGQLPNPAAAVGFGDAWLACRDCHELIEARLVWLLARRGADSEVLRMEMDLAGDELYALIIQVRSLHAVFFASRVGPAVGI